MRVWAVLALALAVSARKHAAGMKTFEDADHCTTIGVGRKATTEGSTFATHTADCFNCDFRLKYVPARDWPLDAQRPVFAIRLDYPRYNGYARGPGYTPDKVIRGPEFYNWTETKPIGHIPQVPHTYGYYDGEYGVLNEFQLGIGESTCFSKLWALPVHAGGSALLDVSELSRIAMERCRTARCAVATMGALAEEYGFYGADWSSPEMGLMEGGEALTVSDRSEVWAFQITADDTGKSAVWVAQRVPDNHVTVSANQFSIGEVDLDDKDNFLASSNLIKVAESKGFWKKENGPFNFKKAYNGPAPDPSYTPYFTRRTWRVLSLAAPSLKLSPHLERYDYPFSVPVDKKLSVQDIMAMNRDHFEGTEFDLTKGIASGPYGNPNRYDRPSMQGAYGTGFFERPISMFRTTYSIITEGRDHLPDALGGRVWFAPHAPHSSVYVPFYSGGVAVPPAYGEGSLLEYSRDVAWWASASVANYAERAYSHIMVDVKKAQDSLENKALKAAAATEEQLAALLPKDADDSNVPVPLEVQSALTAFTFQQSELVVSTWWNLFDYLILTYRDGYRHNHQLGGSPDYNATKLFYPVWWLEQVGFWANESLWPSNNPGSTPLHANSALTGATSSIFSNNAVLLVMVGAVCFAAGHIVANRKRRDYDLL